MNEQIIYTLLFDERNWFTYVVTSFFINWSKLRKKIKRNNLKNLIRAGSSISITAKYIYIYIYAIKIHALSICRVPRESSRISDLVKSPYEIVRKPKMKIRLTDWLVPHESAAGIYENCITLGFDRIYLIANKSYIYRERETISNVRDWTWPISTPGESWNRIAKSL